MIGSTYFNVLHKRNCNGPGCIGSVVNFLIIGLSVASFSRYWCQSSFTTIWRRCITSRKCKTAIRRGSISRIVSRKILGFSLLRRQQVFFHFFMYIIATLAEMYYFIIQTMINYINICFYTPLHVFRKCFDVYGIFWPILFFGLLLLFF